MLEIIGDAGFIAAALGTVAFVVTYSFSARWWRSPGGRYIMTFAAVMAAIMVLGFARLVFGPYPGIWLIRPIAYSTLAIVIWWAVIALVRIQILRRRNGD